MATASASTPRGRIRLAGHGHRVTTFELFFDLVFVFAFTQVTGYLTHDHTASGITQGLLVLALVWWSWSCYAWLGNQAHADTGLLRPGLVVAMVAIFFVALATPEAWEDMAGGLDGAVVVAVAYVVVRAVHMALYMLAARGDPGLHHQLVVTMVPLAAGAGLLVAGAVVGDSAQTAFWAAALAVDWTGVYVTSRGGGGWRLHSVEHWTERHGLVVILALGESVVAIGTGAAEQAVSWSLLAGAALGIVTASALWWLYFDVFADASAEALARQEGGAQVRTAVRAYTYLHFVVIAGIVVTAFGVEEVIAHAAEGEALGGTYAGALCIGPALYLLALACSWRTVAGSHKPARLLAAAVLVALWPLCAALAPLVALAVVLAVLGGVVAFETLRYADRRAEIANARP